MARARSSRRTCTGKAGWLLPPRSSCGWGLRSELQFGLRWGHWQLIVHQKIAVSGLGESGPGGSSLEDAVSQSSCGHSLSGSVPEEGVKAKVRHFKVFFAKLRSFAFYLKVSFWISAPIQVILKVKLSQLFWAGTYQQRSCSSQMVCSGKRHRW